jgi:hypothetical protein
MRQIYSLWAKMRGPPAVSLLLPDISGISSYFGSSGSPAIGYFFDKIPLHPWLAPPFLAILIVAGPWPDLLLPSNL